MDRYAEKGVGKGLYEVCDSSGEDPECSKGTLLTQSVMCFVIPSELFLIIWWVRSHE